MEHFRYNGGYKVKKLIVMISVLLVSALLLSACGGKENAGFDAEKAFGRILEEVKYGSELEDVSKAAEFSFSGVPEGTEIRFWTAADGRLADAAILFRVQASEELEAVKASVEQYIAQRKTEAERYSPEEVSKLENAVKFASGNYYIVCITDDAVTARDVLK